MVNKEYTIDWVHRRFDTSKEELRQLNVTINHSCQEIPSQTYPESGKLEDLDKVNSTKGLWSDAVKIEDDQLDKTKTIGSKVNVDNNQLQKVGSGEVATVNPNPTKIRVEGNLSSTIKQAQPVIEGDRGTSRESVKHGG